MKKQFILFLGLGIFLLLLIIVYGLIRPKKGGFLTTITNNQTTLAPNISPIKNKSTLSIIATNPQQNASNIALNTSISMTFNQSLTSSNMNIYVTPTSSFISQFQSDKLTIVFKNNLATGTKYFIDIQDKSTKELIYTLTFTTTGPTPTVMPDTSYNNQLEKSDEEMKVSRPDIYLLNLTPYNTDTFSITSNGFKTQPTGHYSFIVRFKINDQNKAKSDFITWIKSQGLTDTQINTLDIQYSSVSE